MGNSSSSISPLRQQMIDDMTMRRLSSKTQTSYLRHVIELNYFLGHSPDKATAEDLRWPSWTKKNNDFAIIPAISASV